MQCWTGAGGIRVNSTLARKSSGKRMTTMMMMTATMIMMMMTMMMMTTTMLTMMSIMIVTMRTMKSPPKSFPMQINLKGDNYCGTPDCDDIDSDCNSLSMICCFG